MSYDVSKPEMQSVMSLSGAERYEHLVNKVADWEELWSVGDKDGWALCADDDGKELVPIWPARAYASACCIDTWEDSEPRQITLGDWFDKWTPGMIADGRSVAVFPLPNDKGVVITPEELSSDLADAVEQYG